MKDLYYTDAEPGFKLYQVSTKPSKRYLLIVSVLFLILHFPAFWLLNIIYPATKTIDLTLSVWTTFILLAIGLSMIWMIIHIFIFKFFLKVSLRFTIRMDASLIGFSIDFPLFIKRWFFTSAYFLTILLTFVPTLLLIILFWPLNDVVFILYMSFIIYLVSLAKFFWFFLKGIRYNKLLFKVSTNHLVSYLNRK